MLYEVSEKADKVEEKIDEILKLAKDVQASSKRLELLIDGGVFARMLSSDKETLARLNTALNCAQAVVVYRASPKQKEQVVQFIRSNNPGKVTLAIGDGSNDVNMIQKAHVGIGLMGKEGN